jgi:hypothetical protein
MEGAPLMPGPAYKPRSVPHRMKLISVEMNPPLAWAAIYLGARVAAWLERPTRDVEGTDRPSPSWKALPLLGLAPGGGCLAATITGRPGGLLHHLFTLAGHKPAVLFCGPVRRFPCPDVIRHRALWSADFPQAATLPAAARPGHTLTSS